MKRITSRWAAALAALGLALASAIPGMGPAPVNATDAAAPGGRLIVIWRSSGQSARGLSGVVGELHGPNGRRSVVVAQPGQSARVAANLRSDPAVATVVPDAVMSADAWPLTPPNDPYYATYQPDLPLMGVPAAWQTTTGSPSVIVAVLDTGMTLSHPDLAAVHTVSAWNEIANTSNVADGHGHGTHVIGTIAAQTNNGIGVAGIAPNVSIMPVKVLDDGGSGYFSDILNGVDYARIHGASVINMSLGCAYGTYGCLGSATDVAAAQPTFDAAYAAGITIVVAAGNDGNGSIEYPGAFNHVLSIAATDNTDARAWFSNYNSTVDLAAPGVNIWSTYNNGGYVPLSGTSMATPHVAAVAALVRSAHPSETVDQVEQALRMTAVDLGAPGRDDQFGSGRVNAAAAVAWTPAGPTPTPSPTATPTPTPGPTAAPTDTPASTQPPWATPTPVPEPTPTATPTPTPDLTAPRIASHSPTTSAIHFDRDGYVRIVLSEPVRGISTATVRLRNLRTARWVTATVRYDTVRRVIILRPSTRLASWTAYRVYVRSGIVDVARNPLKPVTWSFRTGAT